ncbi:MAG: sulfite exporter TauE/SafE family protein, partial [Bradyrhizobiaceae bacterium]|nr:sulfite exporter TauE/SafE family protein [Bradyrhizobiaceae bacterium]
MLFGVSLNEILLLALAIVIGGVVTGMLAGLFGIGGGAVIVPVLYEVFGVLGVPEEVRMQLCVGTSIAIIVPTTVRSYLTHRTKGLVVPGVIRLWALPAVIGVACGGAIAAFASSGVF